MLTVNVPTEKEEEWNDWYDKSHMPNVLNLSGYAIGGRFRLLEHPELKWLNMKPKYATFYELEGEAAIDYTSDQTKMSPAHRSEQQNWENYAGPIISDMSWNIYRIIAKHWKA